MKSWRITRAGMNGISASAATPGRHDASVSTSARSTMPPPAWRRSVLEQDLERDRQRVAGRSAGRSRRAGRGRGGPAPSGARAPKGSIGDTRPSSARLATLRCGWKRTAHDPDAAPTRADEGLGRLPGRRSGATTEPRHQAATRGRRDRPRPALRAAATHRHGDGEVHARRPRRIPTSTRRRASRRSSGSSAPARSGPPSASRSTGPAGRSTRCASRDAGRRERFRELVDRRPRVRRGARRSSRRSS